MKVLEFGIGIPPKMKKLFQDKKETEYTVNWLPIGWFVRIKGEDPASDEAHDRDAFSAKRWWARSLVLIAGVTMNFVLAWGIFFWFFLSSPEPLSPNFLIAKGYNSYFLPSVTEALDSGYLIHSGVEVAPLSWSIAARAGILPGDIVEKIDGITLLRTEELKHAISQNIPIELTLLGTGWVRTVSVEPRDGKIGIYLGYKNLAIDPEYVRTFSLGWAMIAATHETYALSHMTVDVLGMTLSKLLFPQTQTDRKEASEMLAGPIGIGAGFVGIAEAGVTFSMIAMIIAMLSINLGVINILPFPALDGGRLVSTSVMSFIAIWTRKTAILIQAERWIHGFGMILLLLLSVLIAYMDIIKIW